MSEQVKKLIAEYGRKIGRLAALYGFKKINLPHETGDNEGIWCVPCDEASNNAMTDDSSRGVKIHVMLCNSPIGSPIDGWGGLCWGAEVLGTTKGDSRPVATLADQTDAEIKASNATLLQAVMGYSLHWEDYLS